ncbi:MAG: hypothetical protein OEY63_08890 [Gemmatimonadota bacterium]|nr:hypothetical protein [Gemmatimonadota bacterium]
MNIHPVEIDVTGWGVKHAHAHAEVAHYGAWARFGRAMEAVVIVWAVAIPFMFVPWLVILAVPAALALSIFLFAERIRAPEVARVCEGVCPDCGAVQKFDLPLRFTLPLAVECHNCNRELTFKEEYKGTLTPGS